MNRRSFYTTLIGSLAGLPFVGKTIGRRLPTVQSTADSTSGTEPYLGEIILFAGNFAPRGWAFCEGQLLAISLNSALFSILGTTYGGDGRTSFALPDLRGRAPIQPGQGPGLSYRNLGEKGGAERTTLLTAHMPAHAHKVESKAFPGDGDSLSPIGNVPAMAPIPQYRQPSGDPAHVMAEEYVSEEGGGTPHENMPPFLGLNYIIALVGTYPSRT